MHFAEGNHPWESFFLQRDDYCRRKSSLGEFFPAEGWLLQKEIIPERAFSRRGMHFAEENHPWRNFSPQRDAFCGRKSSLEELFSSEGWLLQKEIIPGGTFLCRGMIIAEGNHLWRNFFLQRNAFRRRKSSLGELFSAEGCSAPPKSNPWQSFFLNADAILRGTTHMSRATTYKAALCQATVHKAALCWTTACQVAMCQAAM